MMRTDPDFEAWVKRARSVTVEAAAALAGFEPGNGQARLKDRSGPCPRCGGKDRFSINPSRNIWNCRGCGRGGRDGISLIMHCLKLEFIPACEVVEGARPELPPGETDQARRERHARQAAWLAENQRQRALEDARRMESENSYREAERAKVFGFWRRAVAIDGTSAEVYLKARGLTLPPGLRLRYAADWSLYDGDDAGQPRIVHRGPALFAPIVGGRGYEGKFSGLHITWFDPLRPGEKVMITDTDGRRVPAKKVRGVKEGGHIVWHEPSGATRMMIGEGLETVGSVMTDLHTGRSSLLDGCAFWTSIDLGNLAGKAVDRLQHPTATITDKAGRARRQQVPGIVPDKASLAVSIPDTVTDLFLIGDGDSEPFFTRCALARAAARHAQPGRTVRLVMAPAGKDFNDMTRERARDHG